MAAAALVLDAESAAAARTRAAAQWQCDPDELTVQELQAPRAGLLGFGRRPGRYRVRRSTPPADRLDRQVQAALAAGEQLDGSFTVDWQDGQAVLTVQAPGSAGRAVTEADILARLRTLQFPAATLDPALLPAALAQPGTPVALGAWPAGERHDAYVKLSVSGDRMEAHVQVFPPRHGGAMLTVEDIVAALAQQGIVSGVRADNLRAYLSLGAFDAPILAAAGRPPRHGRDARLRYLFKTTRSIELKEDEKGRVDYHELGLIQSVTQGSVVAEKVPAEPGEDGEDIYGRRLPARAGQDLVLHAGRNTQASADGQRLLAAIDGGVTLVGSSVCVEPVHRVDGDVSFATGNIDFAGTVEILGRVPDGFTVRARGDVVVAKTVEAATIEAAGNIVVRGGVLGRGQGLLTAGGDIIVKFAENARLQAGGRIVAEQVMHSHCVCEKHLVLGGRRGALIGGSSVAGGAVECRELGVVGETKTLVQAGVPPRVLQAYAQLNARLRDLREQLAKIEATLQALLRAKEDGTLTAAQAAQEAPVQALAERTRGQLAALQQEEEQLQRYTEHHPAAAVHVRERAYKGVMLVIGAARKTLTNDYRFTTFRNRSGDMAFTPYEGIPADDGKPPR